MELKLADASVDEKAKIITFMGRTFAILLFIVLNESKEVTFKFVMGFIGIIALIAWLGILMAIITLLFQLLRYLWKK